MFRYDRTGDVVSSSYCGAGVEFSASMRSITSTTAVPCRPRLIIVCTRSSCAGVRPAGNTIGGCDELCGETSSRYDVTDELAASASGDTGPRNDGGGGGSPLRRGYAERCVSSTSGRAAKLSETDAGPGASWYAPLCSESLCLCMLDGRTGCPDSAEVEDIEETP